MPETLAVRLFAAVSMMVPSPPSVASTSRAMSWRSCAVPSLIATSSFVAVPPASMLPLPGSSMVTLRLSIPVTEMFPSPRRLRRSREGTLTDTNIGLAAAVVERGGRPRRRVMDLAIAATANGAGVPLLTHNTGDFTLVEDLVDVQAP